jgi:RNA polymerase sigma-70 factor, ECF subfamily
MKTEPAPTTPPDTIALWSEFRRPLAAFLARRVRRPADVDDLLQEVFLRIHTHIEALKESDHVAGWIFKTARNVLIDFERSGATRADRRRAATDELELGEAAVAEEAASSVVPCLRPMIEKLPEPYRESIELTGLGGLTQAAAAEVTGLSLSGMKSRVQRGRERLKELIRSCCQVETDVRGGIMDVECGCGARPA